MSLKSFRRICSLIVVSTLFVISMTRYYLDQELDTKMIVQHYEHAKAIIRDEHDFNKMLMDEQQHILKSQVQRENGTFVTLARNSDLGDLMNTIRSVEDRYNHKHNHDWVFLNDEEFSEEFKNVTTSLISGRTRYGQIGPTHWSYPEWINRTVAAEARQDMERQSIIYGGSESYRHMCRFESGFFFHHPIMQEYKYYWRVEPSTLLHCDLDYDVFKFMRINDKRYGFTISLLEFASTVASLWDVTKNFISHNPQYVAKNNLINFISDDSGQSYNMCHFWSNFEIADMDFWRSTPYQEYFDYLDRAGGFFYERWGDAPVHSIAASLFLDASQVHFFEDIGYTHPPFTHCPCDALERNMSCSCLPSQNFDWSGFSCLKHYYAAQHMPLPKGVDPL